MSLTSRRNCNGKEANSTPLRARARETSNQHLLNRGERSPLPTYFEVVNRRIATFSQRKTDPFHDEIMDFAAFMRCLSPSRRMRRVESPTGLVRSPQTVCLKGDSP